MPVAEAIKESMNRASWIRKMFERGAELKRLHGEKNVFDFTLGNPVLEPPPAFCDALANIASRREEGLHRYMPNAGFPHVRQAIAEKLVREETFPRIDASGVVMAVGAGGGLNAVLKSVLNPDDEVVVLAPFFVEYNFYIRNHGGVPVVGETNDEFDIDVEAVAAVLTPKTKALIVNSPNNPTGRLYGRTSLAALATLLAERERTYGHPIYLLSDEPYRELVYVDDPPPSAAAFHPNSFQIYSWSKSLSIPGERIGYVAVNPEAEYAGELVGGLTFATRTLGFVNAPASMQLAIQESLSVTVDVGWYQRRRDRLLQGLRQAGYDVVAPEGAFYMFPASPLADDVAFVDRAMQERVLVVPGSGFGRKGFFRVAYCISQETLEGGLERLAKLRQACTP